MAVGIERRARIGIMRSVGYVMHAKGSTVRVGARGEVRARVRSGLGLGLGVKVGVETGDDGYQY